MDAGKPATFDLKQKQLTPRPTIYLAGTASGATETTRISKREVSMLKLKSLHIVAALSIALPLGIADAALAAKKPARLTYEQAWARCKVHVDKLQADAQAQRYSRGAACMKMFGYRI